MSSAIKLVVGLGNPGREYERTRHNAGFWFVDELARELGLSFRTESRFNGAVAKLPKPRQADSSQDSWLLKPATFMNRSGLSVASLAGFYKIPLSSILVAHDELDLPVGTVRIKQGGGHGGHNGLRDIIAHQGADYLRLRIGIGHPGKANDVVGYVLTPPPKAEEELIRQAISEALAVMPLILDGECERAMHQLHSR